jgi:hypothetical protein
MMWEEELERRPISIMASNGKLIILNEKGNLYIAAADPRGYKEISSGNIIEGKRTSSKFWTPPVLYGAKIYCKNSVGDLICIDFSE